MLREKLHWKVKEETAEGYTSLCREAATNESVFRSFKTDRRYKQVLEHCSRYIAKQYYNQIKRDNHFLLENNNLYENDRYGSPDITNIYGIHCSTSTMQYIGVLSNLIKMFGDLTGKRIVEIGGGYGGQAMVILSQFKADYTIIDLEDVNLLQERYLRGKGVEIYNTNYPVRDYDLVISNYALTEVMEPLQSKYVKEVCCRSKNGYITCNWPLTADLPKHKVIPDVHGERMENFIIVW